MKLLNQPLNGQLGTELIELLDSGSYKTLNIVVAFAKNSGVLRLRNAFQRFRANGGIINVHVGIDLGGTSFEALNNLLTSTDSLQVVHSEGGQTFHSKIYDFVGVERGVVIVGSNNLTGGGLWTNFETSVTIQTTKDNPASSEIRTSLEQHLTELSKLDAISKKITTQAHIDELLINGYIEKEIKQILRASDERKKTAAGTKIFGRGVPAKLPKIDTSITQYVSPVKQKMEMPLGKSMGETTDSDPTMWMETRKLTGGSRNIVDLSKKSRVATGDPKGTIYEHSDKGYMRGSVEFFGVDPADTMSTKDVTLNFEGIDYEGNTILYPKGDKANGTWRIQIKGVDSAGSTVLNALAQRGLSKSLRHKVLTFTKIRDDYYAMSVFPEEELPALLGKSSLTGYNGPTSKARRVGFF